MTAPAPVVSGCLSLLTAELLTACGGTAPAAYPVPAEAVLQVSDDGRRLVRADGSAFFWLADTAWELFHHLDREEADHYLRDRDRKGFTVIQVVVLAEVGREPVSAARTPWRTALAHSGATQVGFMRGLFESPPFLELVPDQSLVLEQPEAPAAHQRVARAGDSRPRWPAADQPQRSRSRDRDTARAGCPLRSHTGTAGTEARFLINPDPSHLHPSLALLHEWSPPRSRRSGWRA
jgi:hypothetical protein